MRKPEISRAGRAIEDAEVYVIVLEERGVRGLLFAAAANANEARIIAIVFFMTYPTFYFRL